MGTKLAIGLIGDQLPEYRRPQEAAVEMLKRAAEELGVWLELYWISTPSLEGADVAYRLGQMDAVWCSPGSPYLSPRGALGGIRFARERGWPFLGTCAGFQHTVLEYARNVLGMEDAASEEYDPEARRLVVTRLHCPVASETLRINLLRGSRAAEVYGRSEIEEYYYCNFGLNPAFRGDLDEGGLRVTGEDQDGEPRVMELPRHRFYVSTLFVPGASYIEGVIKREGAHPLVRALLQAGLSFREERDSIEAEKLAAC